jgi:hypothetical protein
MRFLAYILLFPLFAAAQFAPAAGISGSTAIHKDSSLIVSWATHCVVERGWQDISDTLFGKVNAGETWMAIGQAGTQGVVSLGDGGSALVGFDRPIINGPGWDFVVFENGFSDTFLELAFVEVSSDGINYSRFPAQSHTQDTLQIDAFGAIQAQQVHNLAGKYRALWGTPFDLDEVPNNDFLDKNHITHLRIIDVVGSIQPLYATFDSEDRVINDPWPTPFPSSGFDLDAVGVIHQGVASKNEMNPNPFAVYPNPTNNFLFLKNKELLSIQKISFVNVDGKTIFETKESEPLLHSFHLPTILTKSGVYYLHVQTSKTTYHQPIFFHAP